MTARFLHAPPILGLLLGATAIAAPLDYQAPPLDNPLKGLVPYSSTAADNRFPHTLEFSYISLKQVLIEANNDGGYRFDWSAVESFLNAAKARGNQGVFRIHCEYPGQGVSIPQFLIDQGVSVHELSIDGQAAWTPDYNSETFREALLATIAALGAYDGDPRVGYLEIGLLGFWGEWHNFGHEAFEASAALERDVLQAFEEAFSTTKLLTRYPEGKGVNANHNRPFGYHDDSFTHNTLGTQPWKFMQLMTQAGALEKWKTQAIGGELFPGLNDCVFEDGCADGSNIATDFIETVEATHATYMRMEGVFQENVPAARLSRSKAAVRRMGYDLYLSKATVTPDGNEFTIATTLENRGVAPFYYHWPVTVGLLDAQGATIEEWPVDWRIDGVLPEAHRDFTATFSPNKPAPAGSQVALRVPNPMDGGRPLRFSNFNQQVDGQAWMVLGEADGTPPEAAPKKVLFIRGGNGTVGFFEGGSDEQGADAFNYSTNGGNHGWGELSAALVAEGFVVEQLAENPVSNGVPTPISLDLMNLEPYSVIVFGSNNAEYTPDQVDAFMSYIEDGGSALFISDANFGQNWGDAPSSDQQFLERFGLTMNQDQGTYSIRRTNEFVASSHPILRGVDEFDGEGVSPITRVAAPANVTSTVVTRARFNVRRNTGSAQGPSESANSNDASLVVATFGDGRVAGHYDRNTFFNANGAGTNINRLDNEVYARNLFNWLAGNSTETTNYAPRGHFPNLLPGQSLREGNGFDVDVVAKDPDGRVASVELKVDGASVAVDTTAPYAFTIPGLTAGSRIITAIVADNLGLTTDVDIAVDVLGGGDLERPFDRNAWTLSATHNTGDLSKAIDGNIGTRWATQQPQQMGQKFSIDFGQREIFHRILLETPDNPDDFPRGYIVRASDDGTDFIDIASGNGAEPITDILLPEPVTYRYLEIEQTGTASFNWWSIHEINLFHPPTDGVLSLRSWLQFYFGNAPPALTDDSDGDGLTLLEEYAYNVNPLMPSESAHPTATTGIDPSDQLRYIDFTFRRWKTASASDVDYVIETSTDLDGWEPAVPDVQFPFDPMSMGNGTETVTARIKFDESVRRKFVRLHLDSG